MTMTTKAGAPVTDAMLDEWADAFERGDWPEGETVLVGRPRLAAEEAKQVTFRLPLSKIAALDRKADKCGETRSAVLRTAVDEYLAKA